MPLSDLFKKPSNQQSPKQPSQEEIFGSPALQKNRADAATEVMGIFDRNFRGPQGIHAGTVLSTGAWLAGTSLQRSFGQAHNSEPGTILLSEKANQEWPKLLRLFVYYINKGGVQLKPDQFARQIPDNYKPQKTILQIQEAHQEEYNAIMRHHGLDYRDGARAGIIVCSMLFNYHCVKRQDIEPQFAAGIISIGLIEGTKTSPMPLKTESPKAPTPVQNNAQQNNQTFELLKSIASNSTDGSGTRFVIGDGMAALEEAETRGGRYTLVHPLVESQLKQKGMDPYLIYEAALRIEIESKIPRIDVIGGNVNDLIQTWKGKPEERIPIYVRLALWLNTNANSLGYERNGNSWILRR
ncbi:MAG: hypothetical protein IPP66_02745 [Anaerolineales bacterium]|nr:hypothetical protein [Anaerolineales bacterium]